MTRVRVRRLRGMTGLLLGACLICCTTAYAGDIVGMARATAAKYQKAVVTVRLVVKVKMNMQGQNTDQEQKLETTGVVIDPSGLTVADAASLDPTTLMKAMMGSLGGIGLKIDSEIKETALVLDDGAEVEADVVLTDADLGLAFIRPRDGARKFDAVALERRAAPAQALDAVIVLGRLSRLGNRAPTLQLDSVRAVVKGPRFFYMTDKLGDPGNVAFAEDGKVLGIYVMLQKPQGAAEPRGSGSPLGMLMNLGEARNMTMVAIRPVNDVIEIAAQAKEVKRPAK